MKHSPIRLAAFASLIALGACQSLSNALAPGGQVLVDATAACQLAQLAVKTDPTLGTHNAKAVNTGNLACAAMPAAVTAAGAILAPVLKPVAVPAS